MSMGKLGGTALLLSPDYFLFDLRTGPSFLFAQVGEGTYRQSSFLDHRISPRPQHFHSLSLMEVAQAASELPPPPALYIAHTSFCCSTLLARCIQAEQLLSLREPRILGVLANEYRRGIDHEQVDPSAHLIFRLLGKSYRASQRVVVKGTNYTNNLVPPLLRLWPNLPVLLMWGDLEDFLVSMCKHREEAEKNLWPFLRAFLIDSKVPHHRHQAWEKLSLLQQAVWVWVLQIRQFNNWLEQHSQIFTLTARDFLAQPLTVTAVLQSRLGLEIDENARRIQVAETMSKDAKKAQSPTAITHAEQRARVREAGEREIKAALAWAANEALMPDLSLLRARALPLA